MNIAGELIALEEQFWKGDADFYRQRLTAEALMVFLDPIGVLGKEETVASIAHAPRWRDVEFTEVKAVMLATDAALLVYRATARRAGQGTYVTQASSVYVPQDGAWRLAFHQQDAGNALTRSSLHRQFSIRPGRAAAPAERYHPVTGCS
jgi:hypothetical protein